MKPRLLVLCLLAACYQPRCQAADTNLFVEITARGDADTQANTGLSTNLIAAGAWSEPVADGQGNRLRGRLMVYEGPHVPNLDGQDVWFAAPVYLEIENLSGPDKHPTQIYFDVAEGLHFELRNGNGTPVNLKPRGGGASITLPHGFWATVPAGGVLRLRANSTLAQIKWGKGGPDPEAGLRLIFYSQPG